MTPTNRRLQAAEGYLELGMAVQAHEELEGLEPLLRDDPRVLALRVYAYQGLGRWPEMEAAAGTLRARCPDEAQWRISLAYATRRAKDLLAAREILLEARTRFPEEVMIHFNLACYACQLGRLDDARAHLADAFRLDKTCRRTALADADLAPLHAELRAGGRPGW